MSFTIGKEASACRLLGWKNEGLIKRHLDRNFLGFRPKAQTEDSCIQTVSSEPSFDLGQRRLAWKFNNERCSVTKAATVHRKRASQFVGNSNSAVKTKTVAVLPRGETMRKNARQVLRRNTNPVVLDFNVNQAGCGFEAGAQYQPFFW